MIDPLPKNFVSGFILGKAHEIDNLKEKPFSSKPQDMMS